MSTHLRDDEMTAAVAGLELGDAAREHLASCVACRQEAAALADLIAERRADLEAQEPAWDEMAEAVAARLPASGRPSARRGGRWLRPALALAATVLIAVAATVLRPARPAPPPAAEPSVEEILAEMNELLADDRIPGFEVIDPGIGGVEVAIADPAS
jgi:hypothetical protein